MRLLFFICMLLASAGLSAEECVVLLHGLGRTDNAMKTLETALTEQDYVVANVAYPSRKHEIAELAEIAIDEGLESCKSQEASPVSFVTHSLGGILVRQYLSEKEISNLHRVVMLGPPNRGSEVVDSLADVPGFDWINGPAGRQLGTGEDDLPNSLGDVDFELGIIAGNKTINPVLSQFLPNPDDGKVSVENTKVDGMCAFVELPVSHALMMQSKEVIREVVSFLESGKFASDDADNDLCY